MQQRSDVGNEERRCLLGNLQGMRRLKNFFAIAGISPKNYRRSRLCMWLCQPTLQCVHKPRQTSWERRLTLGQLAKMITVPLHGPASPQGLGEALPE
eukprot:538235-Amphidinium_carterae.1